MKPEKRPSGQGEQVPAPSLRRRGSPNVGSGLLLLLKRRLWGLIDLASVSQAVATFRSARPMSALRGKADIVHYRRQSIFAAMCGAQPDKANVGKILARQ
jgi:hypothetical protein